MELSLNLSLVLQGGGLALLLWASRQLLESNRVLAVHAEKHTRHDARLEKLEEKIC